MCKIKEDILSIHTGFKVRPSSPRGVRIGVAHCPRGVKWYTFALKGGIEVCCTTQNGILNVNPLCPQNSLTHGLQTIHTGSAKAANMHLYLCVCVAVCVC